MSLFQTNNPKSVKCKNIYHLIIHINPPLFGTSIPTGSDRRHRRHATRQPASVSQVAHMTTFTNRPSGNQIQALPIPMLQEQVFQKALRIFPVSTWFMSTADFLLRKPVQIEQLCVSHMCTSSMHEHELLFD